MKIAVTGGAGFIGTNLLKYLQHFYDSPELLSLDIRPPTYPVPGVIYTNLDVRDAEAMARELRSVDKVFHLAASIGTHESFANPKHVFDVNIGGTLNVLHYATQYDLEVFIAGMPGIWNNPYSISKDAALRMAQSYYETHGTKVCGLRWFSVYGAYQYVSRYNKAVPTFINQALNNEPLTVYGDGKQTADYIIVDDAVYYAVHMVENKHWGKVIECATGHGVSVNTLAEKIIHLSQSHSPIQYEPMRAGEPAGSQVVADVTELNRLFPHTSRVSLDEGLKRTIAYYQQHQALD